MVKFSLFHEKDPYIGFDSSQYPEDLQGWGSTDPNFLKLIDKVNPSLIIEVGTWKGGSAIFMAEYIKQNNLNCKIICVDTWLGAIEFYADRSDPERYGSLQKKNGYPSVYYQFLSNVLHRGLEEIIIPFPQTSVLASRFFQLNNVKADMIYIDASHDERDVYDDLNNYWEILNIGGTIFGDDYDQYWPGVRLGVNNFISKNDLSLEFTERQWMIDKKEEVHPTASIDIYQISRDNKKLALEFERDLFLERTKNVNLSSANAQLQCDLSKLEAGSGELKVLNSELATANDELKVRNRELVADNDELQVRNSELATANDELKVRNRELAADNNELQVRNSELTADKDELQVRNSKIAATNDELKVSNRELAAANDDLKVLNSELKAHYSNLESDNSELKVRYCELEAYTNKLSVDHNEFKEQLLQLQAKSEIVEEQLFTVQDQLSKAQYDTIFYKEKYENILSNYLSILRSKKWLLSSYIKKVIS